MGIIISVPAKQTFPLITENRFSATFNAITPGLYDWNGDAIGTPNNNVQILKLDPWSVYIIERINFSCNVAEQDFKDVQVSGQALKMRLYLQESKNNVFLDPIPFINYVDNLEVYLAFKTHEETDWLNCNFDGQLSTNFNIAGKLIVTALVQFNLYRVSSTTWVKRFDDMKLDTGAGLGKQ